MTIDPIPFINQVEIQNRVPISNNISTFSGLVQAIIEAQESYIQPLLTEKLYDECQTQFKASQSNPNAIEQRILDLIEVLKPSLSWYAIYEFLPYNSNKIKEAGLTKLTSDNFEVVDQKSLNSVMEKIWSSGQRNSYKVTDFIEKNLTEYPEYEIEFYEQTQELGARFWVFDPFEQRFEDWDNNYGFYSNC
jgi:hypothetical protein